MIKGKEAKEMMRDDDELFRYSMELLGSQIANISVALVLGIISGRWLEIVLFVLTFVSLRRYAGGYHCESSRACFWTSTFIMAVAVGGIVLLQTWLSRYPGAMPWICLWELSVSVFIFLAAPVEAVKKPLDALEKKVYGKRAKITVAVQMVIGLLLLFFRVRFGAVVIITHSIIAATMLFSECLQGIYRAKNKNPHRQGDRG